ncbi:Uma2 family endonuclease [Streptomyces virginiae]|uniref:Uma2 family endonuclease n=1 Tax=Streptomyces virginiae TaxID=1961 RepID=UPI00224E760E|nr:Uma2 family endonuclease [Streptomyces virginiae]MCX4959299.1 Uma2 family endonuclease [Streptomyces virginiae]
MKYAVQHHGGDRTEIVEGVITNVTPSWDHESAAEEIRDQLRPRVKELGCVTGSGILDLPGSSNWYVPDLAVVPKSLAKGAGALLPDQVLLIVEITSESDAETDRVVKRKRYAEYGAPLYLLVDRVEATVTLFALPGRLGYTKVDGPHPFGTPVRVPEPFGIDLDISGL